MSYRVRAFVSAAIAVLAVAGCADQPAGDQAKRDPQRAAASPAVTSHGPVTLFDRSWLVEEGVWYITTDPDTFPSHDGAFDGQRNGLVGAQRSGTLWLWLPALYGKYHVRMEQLDAQPAASGRFKDVVEVSFRSAGTLEMGSFESFSKSMPLPAGSYRVRFSATDLDRVTRQTNRGEFRGARYKTYSGRILIQFWPAPMGPDAVLREGTRFAERAHRNPGP